MNRTRSVHEVAFRLAFDMQTQMAGKVDDFGAELTPLKMRMLRTIWSSNKVSAQDIAQVVKRDKAQVARLVEDLCEQELVHRKVDPNDRRSKLLYLTERGEQIFSSVEEVEKAFSSQLIKGIRKSDLGVFFAVADAISENLKSMNTGG